MKQILPILIAVFFLSNLDARLPDLIPYHKGNYWGYCDSTKKIILQCVLDEAQPFSGDSARATFKGQTGYVMKNGDFHADPPPVVTPGQYYSWITWTPSLTAMYFITTPYFSSRVMKHKDSLEYLTPASDPNSGRVGYVNLFGDTLIPTKFTTATSFSEGLAGVSTDSICGYIDTKGKWVFILPRMYTELGTFTGSVAVIGVDEYQHGLINKKGKFILPPFYESIEVNSQDGLVKVSLQNMVTFYTLDGKLINGLVFSFCEMPYKNYPALAQTADYGYYGYLNEKLEWIIKPVYEQAQAFSMNYAAVYNGEGWSYIDRKGKKVFANTYESANPFDYYGLAEVSRSSVNFYIDIHGTEYWEE